jgi:hypothetical protein
MIRQIIDRRDKKLETEGDFLNIENATPIMSEKEAIKAARHH